MMQEHINYYKHFLLFVVIWIPNQTQTPVRQKIGVTCRHTEKYLMLTYLISYDQRTNDLSLIMIERERKYDVLLI